MIEIKNPNCDHQCSGNCRRNGCNCNCGEYHLNDEEVAELTEDKRREEAEDMRRDDIAEVERVYNNFDN